MPCVHGVWLLGENVVQRSTHVFSRKQIVFINSSLPKILLDLVWLAQSHYSSFLYHSWCLGGCAAPATEQFRTQHVPRCAFKEVHPPKSPKVLRIR